MNVARALVVVLVVLFLAHASSGADELGKTKNLNTLFAPLTLDQKLEDFRYVVSTLRNSYGPLAHKAETAKLNFEDHVKQTENKIRESHGSGQKDQEFFNILSQFINRFQDSHLSLIRPDYREVTLGFGIRRVLEKRDGKDIAIAVISSIDRGVLPEKDFPIYLGDEVVSIDGKTPGEIAEELSPQVNWSSPDAKPDFLFAYIPYRRGNLFDVDQLLKKSPVRVELLDNQKNKQSLHLYWVGAHISMPPTFFTGNFCIQGFCEEVAFLNSTPRRTVEGAETSAIKPPPFIRSIDNCTLLEADVLPGWKEPSPLKEWEQNLVKQSPFSDSVGTCTLSFAEGRASLKIGIVPIQSFKVNPAEAYKSLYKRIFTYMQNNVHALIVDTRGNPGGNSDYLKYLVSLLTDKSIDMGTMTLPLNRYVRREILIRYAQAQAGTEDHARYRKMVEDFDAGLRNGKTHLENAEFFGNRDVMPLNEKGFKSFSKPLFVLQDSFCASCGDWFPGALKVNGRSINIGTNTLGAGGHTEEVGPLSNSDARLSMTFSLFKLSNGDLVEDRGIAPHHVVRMTQADYRNGFNNKDGYRDSVLNIVRKELQEKILRPSLEKQRQDLDEILGALKKDGKP